MSYSFTELEALWVAAGGSRFSAAIAAAVALAESSGNPTAISASGDYGLWQINLHAHPQYNPALLLTAAYNAGAAVAISGNGAGWTQWCTAYTDGACGTKGGHYDPFGNSPVGRIYQANSATPRPGATPGGKPSPTPHTQLPHRPTGPVGKPRATSVATGWQHLTHALGSTIVSQSMRADQASRGFQVAIGAAWRPGAGLQGPVGGK